MPIFEVATLALPIGNPQDITLRGLEALKSATLIFCEDTRKIQRLYSDLGIQSSARFVSLPGDEERNWDWARSLSKAEGLVLQVSDAGTPIINDPGKSLVEFCRKNQIKIQALPGASAPIVAMQMSGGFGLPFTFAGFAPKARPQSSELKKFFSNALGVRSFIFFDTKHQIENTLEHLSESEFAESNIYVLREMTKTYEEILLGTPKEIKKIIGEKVTQQTGIGELTLVLQGIEKTSGVGVEPQDLLSIRNAAPKEAAKIISKVCGLSTKEAYNLLLGSKSEE